MQALGSEKLQISGCSTTGTPTYRKNKEILQGASPREIKKAVGMLWSGMWMRNWAITS